MVLHLSFHSMLSICFQGVSPVLRQTDPCPPLPSFYGQSASITDSLLRTEATVAVGKKGSRVDEQLGDRLPKDHPDGVKAIQIPDWVPTLRCLLSLELSGKWPEELAALRRVKSSFLAAICQCLQTLKISASLSTDSVKVLKDGFVFELRIAHPRELASMKRLEEEVAEENTDASSFSSSSSLPSVVFQRRHFALPHLASVVNGLNAQFPAFGATCRLLKRWVASQLLIDFFPHDGLALELVTAYFFLHPHPYASAAAVHPQTGFLRVLRLISTWNWKLTPMLINFNEELSANVYREKQRELTSLRRQQVDTFHSASTPALFIVTPYDKSPSEWTAEGPPVFILSRLVAVAQASLRLLVDSLAMTGKNSMPNCLPAFRPPLEGFNVLIRLRQTQLPTSWWNVDNMEPPEALITHLKPRSKGLMPVHGFDPARRFVEVREVVSNGG